MRWPIIFLHIFFIVHHSFSIQKFFDKKYVTSNSFGNSADIKKVASETSEPMNKITCSSLCLRDSRENCHAFRVNDNNECELIKNPEKLQEVSANCADKTSPVVWTSKDLLPDYPLEYVMVVGGFGNEAPKTEIFNLGCPTFQCDKKNDLPELRSTEFAVGGMIGDTPILCGGKDPDIGTSRYGACFKFIQINGAYQWVPAGSLSQARSASGFGSIVIENQLLVSGGVLVGQNQLTTLQELVSLNGELTSSALKSPAFYAHCMVQINETSVLVNGGVGKNHDKLTTFMNFKSGITSTGPEMTNKRAGHTCSKVIIGGDTIIFSIGAGTPFEADFQHKTEYLNLDKDNAEWKAGPDLPSAMRNLKVIPSRNEMTLFLVGGWKPPTRDDFVKEIYQLVCGENTVESCQWMDTGLKLEHPRLGHLVFPIPESMATELCK